MTKPMNPIMLFTAFYCGAFAAQAAGGLTDSADAQHISFPDARLAVSGLAGTRRISRRCAACRFGSKIHSARRSGVWGNNLPEGGFVSRPIQVASPFARKTPIHP